jgi:hypothetical protein
MKHRLLSLILFDEGFIGWLRNQGMGTNKR